MLLLWFSSPSAPCSFTGSYNMPFPTQLVFAYIFNEHTFFPVISSRNSKDAFIYFHVSAESCYVKVQKQRLRLEEVVWESSDKGKKQKLSSQPRCKPVLSVDVAQHVCEEMCSCSFFELAHNSGWYCHSLEDVWRGLSALLKCKKPTSYIPGLLVLLFLSWKSFEIYPYQMKKFFRAEEGQTGSAIHLGCWISRMLSI